MNNQMPMGYIPPFKEQNDFNKILDKLNILERKVNKLEKKLSILENNIMSYNIPNYPNNYLI
jgi:hypothetical protein